MFSIEKVGDELRAGADELTEWAADRGNGFFLAPDEALLASLAAVVEWVATQR